MKCLIIRTDRLGDTVLASPTWQSLKEERPDASVFFLTRRPFLPLFEGDPLLDGVLAMPEGGRGEVREFGRRLTSLAFDVLLVLHVDRPVARLVRQVPAAVKVGPLSKPRSWFLFNRPVRQNRSESLLHEAEYNGRLLEALGLSYRPHRPRIFLPDREKERGRGLFTALFGERPERRYIVLHPGMGGSSLNWPVKRYESLLWTLLQEREETVVITGTEHDRASLGSVTSQSHPRLVDTVGKLDLVELSLLLQKAAVFIGPSTGPMHLATALDTPVVTVFSPLAVQQPRRWGPYRARASVLTPRVECKEKYRCRQRRCRDFNCMDRIAVGEVLAAVTGWLRDS